MRVLLTGASGFVGGHTARALHADGHELRLLTRASSDLSRLHYLPHEHVIVDLASDLSGDHSGLDAACEGMDVVVHVAARLRGRDETSFMRTNSLATAALGQAARRAGVKSFVHLSSVAALGPAPGDEPEPPDTPIHPISLYGRSQGRWRDRARRARRGHVDRDDPPAAGLRTRRSRAPDVLPDGYARGHAPTDRRAGAAATASPRSTGPTSPTRSRRSSRTRPSA